MLYVQLGSVGTLVVSRVVNTIARHDTVAPTVGLYNGPQRTSTRRVCILPRREAMVTLTWVALLLTFGYVRVHHFPLYIFVHDRKRPSQILQLMSPKRRPSHRPAPRNDAS